MEWKTVDGQKGLVLDGVWVCEALIFAAVRVLEEDVLRLRAALEPIRRHAQSHDLGAPLVFSVAESREIVRKVDEHE